MADETLGAIWAEMRIERVSLRNAEQAFCLIEEYYEEIGVVKRDDRTEILRYIEDSRSGVWIAYSGTIPIGCILLRPLPEMIGAGEIKRLYVRPGYRRQRIAEELLQALEDFAARQHTEWLYLDTKDDLKAAIAFYERNGYQRCERYNDNPQATIFMRKRIGLPAQAT